MTERAVSVSICICTMDRPLALQQCLDSIAQSASPPDEVLVSDDSADPGPNRALCAAYPFVRFLAGPRTGLCANRNAVIAAATSDYVSLMDDDAILSESFIATARRVAAGAPDNVIFTGPVIEPGATVEPGNPTFWGHFGAAPDGAYRNVNLNCNLFPRAAFGRAHFDEAITFGYEDMDLCAQLLAAGFRIQYVPELTNQHFPPTKSAARARAIESQIEQARFYTSLKRYLLWQKRPLAFAAFVVLAPLHRAAHAVKHRKWHDLARCVPDMLLGLRKVIRARGRRHAPVRTS